MPENVSTRGALATFLRSPVDPVRQSLTVAQPRPLTLPCLDGPRCPRCAARLPQPDARCVRCRFTELELVAAAGAYDGWLRRLIHAAKFVPAHGRLRPVIDAFAEQLLFENLTPCSLLVPVPVGNRRSALSPHLASFLSRELAKRLHLRHESMLVRVRPGTPQRLRAREARLELAASEFACAPLPSGVDHVWLVDDVMTTGATLEAAASALKACWPGLPVSAMVLARSDRAPV